MLPQRPSILSSGVPNRPDALSPPQGGGRTMPAYLQMSRILGQQRRPVITPPQEIMGDVSQPSSQLPPLHSPAMPRYR